MATESSYGLGLSNQWSDEQKRLAGVEATYDPGTFRFLDMLGLGVGMHCLELGGGGGSVARWMAERVGPSGSVLVTDIDVGALDGCEGPNIEVRVHDAGTDPIDECAFDIIHSRLVLEHIPARFEVLDKLVAALRPGGALLIENADLALIADGPLLFPEGVLATTRHVCGRPQKRPQEQEQTSHSGRAAPAPHQCGTRKGGRRSRHTHRRRRHTTRSYDRAGGAPARPGRGGWWLRHTIGLRPHDRRVRAAWVDVGGRAVSVGVGSSRLLTQYLATRERGCTTGPWQ